MNKDTAKESKSIEAKNGIGKTQNKLLVNIAVIASSLAFIAVIFTRNVLPLLILIPASFYLYKHKAETKEKEGKREELTIKSYSILLLLPVGIILIVLLYLFFWKLFPSIISNWHG